MARQVKETRQLAFDELVRTSQEAVGFATVT
jgi:hypothetical protein